MLSLLALPFHFSEAHFKVGSEGQVYRINRESGTGSSIWALCPPHRCVPRLEAGPRHRSPVSADTAVSWGGRGLPALSSSPVSVQGGSQSQKLTLGRVSVPPFESVHGEKYWTKCRFSWEREGVCAGHPTCFRYPVSTQSLCLIHILVFFTFSQLLEKFWRYRKTEENSTVNSDS